MSLRLLELIALVNHILNIVVCGAAAIALAVFAAIIVNETVTWPWQTARVRQFRRHCVQVQRAQAGLVDAEPEPTASWTPPPTVAGEPLRSAA